MESGADSQEVNEEDEDDEFEVWEAVDTEDSVTAAELLDHGEDVAEEMSAAGDDGTPETHLKPRAPRCRKRSLRCNDTADQSKNGECQPRM
jgi:hypothetical protein